MKKRIFSIILAALMLVAIVPFTALAADDPVNLYLGFGSWDGSQFSDGLVIRPSIWKPITDVSGLKAAVVKAGASDTAAEQTSPYTITNAQWTTGVTTDDYGTKRFDWTETTVLEFDLYALGGRLPSNFAEGNNYTLDVSKITLKVSGTESAVITAGMGHVRSGGIAWHVFVTWTKRTAFYGNDEATLTAYGLSLDKYKEGDAFPTYTVTGERAKYYTVETDWYYAEGEYGHYTRGAKVTETTIQPEVAYDCEVTFKLKADAPVPSTGTPHWIYDDGSAEVVLFNTDTSKNISGYFSYSNITGVNDIPNKQTLTARRFVTFGRIVKDVVVKGVTAPMVGGTPKDYGITIAEPFDKLLEVKSAAWSGNFAADGTFKAGEKYTLTIKTDEGGDLRELDALNKSGQGYKLVTAEGGTVVSFTRLDPVGLQIVIEYVADPADLGEFYIDLSNGKVTVAPEDPAAFKATMDALVATDAIRRDVITSAEDNLDLDIDGTYDVVIQNGNQYQAYDGASITTKITLTVGATAFEKIKNSGAIAYYSSITFKFSKEAPIGMQGDMNGDGSVNAKDVIALMKHLVGATPANFVPGAADYDGNGKVNGQDVIKLMKDIVAGKFNAKG